MLGEYILFVIMGKQLSMNDDHCRVCIKNFCSVATSGYHGVESGSPSASPGSQHWNIHTHFKEGIKFLGSQVGLPATKIR